MNHNTANARCRQLVERYPQVGNGNDGFFRKLFLIRLFQIWEYLRTVDHPVFYYTSQRSDSRAPPGSLVVTNLELLSWLSGPALIYRKDIIVCTHTYHDIPNADFLNVVRL